MAGDTYNETMVYNALRRLGPNATDRVTTAQIATETGLTEEVGPALTALMIAGRVVRHISFSSLAKRVTWSIADA